MILKKYKFIAFILLLGVIAIFFYLNSDKNLKSPTNPQIISKTIKTEDNNIQEISNSSRTLSDLEKSMSKISFSDKTEESPQDSILLTAENFEDLVEDCIQQKPCDAPADPWKLYQHFKRTKNSKANYSLISYLSIKKFIDPNFRNQYKNVVKQMIEDFYPSEDEPSAMAEYYMNIGENQKSLDIYLELEKKSKYDPHKNSAPNLNIANIYYDLNRFNEALPYYQAAYDMLLVNKQNDPNQVPVMDYIRGRINEINKRLNEDAR